VLLADEPALAPYQQIYRRLIRNAVSDAADVAQAEIEAKGIEQGLDDGMGRMVVLAEADRELGRLEPAQIDAIVRGTDEVLDFLADSREEEGKTAPAVLPASFDCVGGRGEIDDAAAAIVAFALRHSGAAATSRRRGEQAEDDGGERLVIDLICYASHPSDAVRRYNIRKLRKGRGRARHVVDYDVAPAPALSVPGAAGAPDILVGDLATLCRLALQHTASLAPAPAAVSNSPAH
jgi:hypothetical protein